MNSILYSVFGFVCLALTVTGDEKFFVPTFICFGVSSILAQLECK